MSLVDVENVPLKALKPKTRSCIAAGLNPIKWLPSEDGYDRDYRGLAEVAGLDGKRDYSACDDPTSSVLADWAAGADARLGDLLRAFELLDRFDVLDDVLPFIEADARDYDVGKEWKGPPVDASEFELRNGCITRGDVAGLEDGSGLAKYDAFLLFADADTEFADRTRSYLEDDCGMRLCVKERDLLAGVPFEHDAVMELIRDRCRHLVIVVSVEFYRSPECRFYTKFAQALSIEKRARVVLPIRYKEMPPESTPSFLMGIHTLDYTRALNGRWNFWEKLRDSVRDARAAAAEKSAALAVGRPIPSLVRSESEPRGEEAKLAESDVVAREKMAAACATGKTSSSVVRNDDPSSGASALPVKSRRSGKFLMDLFKRLPASASSGTKPTSVPSSSACGGGGDSSTLLLASLPDPPSGDLSSAGSDVSAAKASKNKKDPSGKGKWRRKLGPLAS